MSDEVVGYITIKVPVIQVDDPGTMEQLAESYLVYGESSLVGYELTDEKLAWLGHEISYGDIACNFVWPDAELTDLAEKAQERIDAVTPYPENIFITGGKP